MRGQITTVMMPSSCSRRHAGRAAGMTSQPLTGDVDVEHTEGEAIEVKKIATYAMPSEQ
jgi:hypothetical protein